MPSQMMACHMLADHVHIRLRDRRLVDEAAFRHHEDATESYFAEFKAAALAMIRAQGAIVGWTARVDQVLAALWDG